MRRSKDEDSFARYTLDRIDGRSRAGITYALDKSKAL